MKTKKENSAVQLENFIAESLKQIITGISKAQIETANTNALINPLGVFVFKDKRGESIENKFHFSPQTVEFDIAVTAVEQDKSKGVLGVVVGSIGAGVQGQVDTMNSSINRIKFSVPIYFPYQIDEHTENKPKAKHNPQPISI